MPAAKRVYVLGGYQSDFAKNWARDGLSLFDMFASTIQNGLDSCRLEPNDIEVGHVGNFVGDLFCNQGQLGGFFGHVDPKLTYLPASRHEAACASGSMALLAAMADIESSRYDLACVIGIEMMRNVSGQEAANFLRPAAWSDQEYLDAQYLWPQVFAELAQTYMGSSELSSDHLRAISKKNFNQGLCNPNSQCRNWKLTDQHYENNSDLNPIIAPPLHKQDCGQITDGACVLFLASEKKAKAYARARRIDMDSIPYIKGWGHINAPMLTSKKTELSKNEILFPHVQSLFQQTLKRAGMKSIHDMSGMEVHDCFNITEYMIMDHSGFTDSGKTWQAIEEGAFNIGGPLPVNASGGLMGSGHPVGATGVRMLLDAYKQVTYKAGDYQIGGAKNIMTFNLGGSATTCASFILGR